MATSVPPVPATTREVLAQHERLARYIHGHFRRKLTVEDARDCAAEALAEADHAVRRGTEIGDIERWLRRAAWHNALDAVRQIEGEAQTPRPRPVDLGEHTDRLQDTVRFDRDVDEQDARQTDAQALARVWERLSCDEQRALRLRHHDELDVPQILGLMGCSRHHYENLTKRALRKLRDALVSDTPHPACRETRAQLLAGDRGMPLEHHELAARDLHLEACLSCRAFDGRRRRLMGTLPLPALGLVDRVIARLHGRVSSGGRLTEHADTLSGGAALASAGTATATATGTSGLLGAAGAIKAAVAICSAGAVTAGLCTEIPRIATDEHPPTRHAERAVATPPATTAAAALIPVRATPFGHATPATATAAAAVSSARSAGRSSAGSTTTTSGSASPFAPESGARPVLAKPTAKRTTEASAATLRSSGEPATTRSAPRPVASTPASATTTTTGAKPGSFSEEFSP